MTEARQPTESRVNAADTARLHGRYLLLVRVAWVLLAVVILGLDAAGIPYTYAQYNSVCTLDPAVCVEKGLLTSDGVEELKEYGLSMGFYAAYQGVGLESAFTLVCFLVAAVIFARRSDDRMALFASFVLMIFGGAGAAGTMRALIDVHPAFWFPVNLLDYVSQICFGILFYLFPDGRFVPRWTRWLAVASALFFVPITFMPESSLSQVSSVLFFAFLVSLIVVQVYRYRRISTPDQRQQTKWVVFGFAVAVAGFVAVLITVNVFVPDAFNAGPVGVMIGSTVIYGLLLLIPLSIGIAILRSGLWDIDIIIRRTLLYGTLTVLLAAIYAGSVIVLQQILTPLIGGNDQLTIVASTLAIAALFQPLRGRIQAIIDRRFYRRRYDAQQVLAAFSITARDEVDLDRLTKELLTVTEETLQPSHVSLWLR